MATPSDREKRRIALQRKHEQLDTLEPFTKQEQRALGNTNMAFIRNIQISRKVSKSEAKKIYGEMNLKTEKQRKRAYKEERKRVNEYYSQKKPFKIDKLGNVSTAKTKKEKEKEKKQLMKLRTFVKTEKKKLSDFLHSEKFKRSPRYESIRKQHAIYRDATLFELRHGVNSTASIRYRLKHGLEGEYSGRINKTKT